jgi:hypothetical protein
MSETIAILRDKRAKLSAKVAKMASALETARAELSDTETAIKVLVQMGLAPDIDSDTPAAAPVTESQEAILSVTNLMKECLRAKCLRRSTFAERR